MGVGSAATVAVVCDVKVYDWVAWTGCVAKVPYYFEIPPFFPFTRGYLILAFDGMAYRAEDECELIQPGVTWFDIVMSKIYRHNLRRHLIKLHPRNDQITVVRAVKYRCHFCIVTMTLTEEYARRNSHEFRHVVGQNGD